VGNDRIVEARNACGHRPRTFSLREERTRVGLFSY
jgi:hypothetical protein